MEDIGVSKSDVVITKQLKGCVYAYLGKVSDLSRLIVQLVMPVLVVEAYDVVGSQSIGNTYTKLARSAGSYRKGFVIIIRFC